MKEWGFKGTIWFRTHAEIQINGMAWSKKELAMVNEFGCFCR